MLSDCPLRYSHKPGILPIPNWFVIFGRRRSPSSSNVFCRNVLRVYGNSQALRPFIVQNAVLMRIVVLARNGNQRPMLRLQQSPFAFIVAQHASFAMLMRLLALGAGRPCFPVAHPLVAVVTNAAFIAQLAKAERTDLP